MPSIQIADTRGETKPELRLMLTNYAQNQAEVDEATEAFLRGRPLAREEGDDRPPVPGDFAIGAKIKVRGRFTRQAGTSAMVSDGVLDYLGHETLEPAPGAPAAPAR
jgi:hypothetical protein